ncbi:unnamed protein product [Boreogadus saida]
MLEADSTEAMAGRTYPEGLAVVPPPPADAFPLTVKDLLLSEPRSHHECLSEPLTFRIVRDKEGGVCRQTCAMLLAESRTL